MRSTQSNTFNQTPRADIPRSSFDLSHGLKTTFDAGYLVPILSLEVLPGDTINCRAALFGRLATPLKPILDNLHLETFFFFTPYRQVWTNWVKFHGEQENPDDSIDFVIPQCPTPVGGWTTGSLGDYLGVPPLVELETSALPFRIYNHIYNNWFRDQNLIDRNLVATGDGPDNPVNYSLWRRRKRRDYLTSVLPWPQKGPETIINVGGFAPVTGIGMAPDNIVPDSTPWSNILETQGTATYPNWYAEGGGTPTQQMAIKAASGDAGALPEIYADLSNATGISINDLRESFQIQKLLERDARSGTRYPEILRSHFGVTDPMMLVHQRPLFLGGGTTMINISPVQQTSGTAADPETGYTGTVQGNLAAYGTVSANNHGFTYSATEHGHIIGLVNVRADLTYQQGLERYWSRQTRFDFYYPALAHLGEQAVLNKEIFAQGTSFDDDVFGYIPRWDEYRFKQSQISGLFRSSASASLDVWHLAQDFASLPVLNKAFIEENPPIDRVVAVPSEPDFLLDVYFKIRAARPLPLFGTPGLIDHF